MERVIVAVAAVTFLLVACIAAMVEGLNQLHRWEEWGSQDDRKGVGA